MELPRFLMADNEEFPENTYVLHTEKPCFILDVDSEEFRILDGTAIEEEAMQDLIEQALGFYEDELNKYDEDEE